MNAQLIISPPKELLISQHQKSVLLITESEEVIEQIQELLTQLHITLYVIPFDELNPDDYPHLSLLFLDAVSLPDSLTNMCLTLKSKQYFPSVPLILISPIYKSAVTLDGLKAGADDFIHQPIQSHEFLIRIQSHLTKEAWREQAAIAKERNLIIAELFAGMNQELPRTELLDLYLQEMIVHTQSFQACFCLFDSETQQQIWTNPLPNELCDLDEDVIHHLHQQQEPVWLKWCALDPAAEADDDSAAVLLAIRDSGNVLGILVLRFNEDHPAHQTRLVSTSVIGDILAVIISRYSMEESLESYMKLMQRDLENLGYMQQMLLPQKLPDIAGLEMEAFYMPAHQAGGDYYDVIQLTDDHIAIIMADVSGHGAPAAMNMGIARSIIHTVGLSQQTHPHQTVFLLNKLLCRLLGKGVYITMFYSVLNIKTKELEWCNAGHVPSVWIRTNDEQVEVIGDPSNGPALGWWDDAVFESGRVQLKPNDKVIFYTDGMTEALNHEQKEFALERLLSIVKQSSHLKTKALLEQVKQEVFEYIADEDIMDDIAIFVLSIADCISPPKIFNTNVK